MREVQVDLKHLQGALGGTVYSAEGERIGTLTTVYLHDETRQPEWIEVRTGWLKRRLVPLDHAQVAYQRVDVPYQRRLVQDTPRVKEQDGVVVPDDEDRLFEYYGLPSADHIAHPLRPVQRG